MAARSSTSFLVDREFTTTKYNSTAADINVTGAFDIDSTGALSINASAGAINMGNDAVAQNMNIGTGAAARTITMGNVTAATTVALNSGTGGFALTSTGTTATTTVNNGLVVKSGTAAAISTTRALTVADSGGVFSITAATVYTISLPAPAQGLSFKFVTIAAATEVVTIQATGAYLYGNIYEDALVAQINGSTNLLLTDNAPAGACAVIEGIDSTHWMVIASGSGAAAANWTVS